MTGKKPKVLLIMQNLPLGSTFLAQKFLRLSEQLDVHLMVWDTREHLNSFVQQNALNDSLKSKIHFGTDRNSSLLSLFINLTFLFFTNSKLRNYLLRGEGTLITRLKLIAQYLPIFIINPD